MRRLAIAVAFVVVATLSERANAHNHTSNDEPYPSTTPTTGQAAVQGVAQATNGLELSWAVNRSAGFITFQVVSPFVSWMAVGTTRVKGMDGTGVMGSAWGVNQLSLTSIDSTGPPLRPIAAADQSLLWGKSGSAWSPTAVSSLPSSWPPANPQPASSLQPLVPGQSPGVPPLLADVGGRWPVMPVWHVMPSGGSRLIFSRSLAAGQDPDDVTVWLAKPQWLAVSHANAGVFAPGYHGLSNRKAMLVSLDPDSGGCSMDALDELLAATESGKMFTRSIHGLTMFAGWGLAAACGIYVARYCRHNRWWIEVHVKLMSIASAGAISAIILAIGMVQKQLAHLHAVLGTAIVLAAVVQVSMGTFVHHERMGRLGLEGGASACESALAACHRILGKVILCCALANAFEGVKLIGIYPWAEYVLIAVCSIAGAAFLLAEYRLQLRRRSSGQKKRQQRDLMLGTAIKQAGRSVSKSLATASSRRRHRSRSRQLQGLQSIGSADGTSSLIQSRTGTSRDVTSVTNPMAAAAARSSEPLSSSSLGSDAGSSREEVEEDEDTAAGTLQQAVLGAAQMATKDGVPSAVAKQLNVQVVLATVLDRRHCRILGSHPATRSVAQVKEIATALAALPFFAGARLAAAQLHAKAVRRPGTVLRVAAAATALREAQSRKRSGSRNNNDNDDDDRGGPVALDEVRIVETWWRGSAKLRDLAATAMLVRHDPGLVQQAAATALKEALSGTTTVVAGPTQDDDDDDDDDSKAWMARRPSRDGHASAALGAAHATPLASTDRAALRSIKPSLALLAPRACVPVAPAPPREEAVHDDFAVDNATRWAALSDLTVALEAAVHTTSLQAAAAGSSSVVDDAASTRTHRASEGSAGASSSGGDAAASVLPVTCPFIVVHGCVTIGLLPEHACDAAIRLTEQDLARAHGSRSSTFVGMHSPARKAVTNPAATGSISAAAASAGSALPDRAALHAEVGRSALARVAIHAGQQWSYLVAVPHVVLEVEPGTSVIAFEPEAWKRFNDHGAKPVPVLQRLADSAGDDGTGLGRRRHHISTSSSSVRLARDACIVV